MLEQLVNEYGHFKYRRVTYSTRSKKYIKDLYDNHPPIPKFEWYDDGKRFVAGMSITVIGKLVIVEFNFARDGKPCTFQPILNSYKRQQARAEIQNICSLC